MNGIGAKIRDLRKVNKDTLQSLADKIDYDASNLSKIERGKVVATVELLEKIMDVYKVEANYFFGVKTRIKIDDTEVTEDEIKEAVKLIRFIRSK